MNVYGLIAFFLLTLIAISFLDLKPHIQQLAQRIVDIPALTQKGSSPHLFDLAVRLVYLIVIVAIVKILLSRKSGNDQ